MAPLQRFLFWASLITFLYAILMLFPSFRSQGGVSTTSQKGLDKSLSMTESQCAKAFPGLTDKLNRMAQRDLFDVEKIMSHVDGHAQGRITDGKVELSCASYIEIHALLLCVMAFCPFPLIVLKILSSVLIIPSASSPETFHVVLISIKIKPI